MPYYVYTLADPRTDEIRYVGLTVSPELRLRQHIHNEVGTNASKRHWVEEILKAGFEPRMEIIEIVESKEMSTEREKFWIQYHFDKGASLLNVRVTHIPNYTKPETPRKIPKIDYSLAKVVNGQTYISTSQAIELLQASKQTFYTNARPCLHAHRFGGKSKPWYSEEEVIALRDGLLSTFPPPSKIS